MIGLKLIRGRCNYSIGSFAKLIGVSRQIVSEWELGKKEIPPKRKKEISNLLGISEDLLGEINDQQKNIIINKAMFAYDLDGVTTYSYIPPITDEYEFCARFFPAEYEPEIEQYIRLERERKHLLEQMDSAFHGNGKYYNSAHDKIKAFYRDITIYNHFLNCYNEIWDESLEKKTHRMLYYDLFSVILDSVFRAYSNAPELEVEEKDLYGELEPGENPFDILHKQLTNEYTRLIKNTLEDSINLADHRIKSFLNTSDKLTAEELALRKKERMKEQEECMNFFKLSMQEKIAYVENDWMQTKPLNLGPNESYQYCKYLPTALRTPSK